MPRCRLGSYGLEPPLTLVAHLHDLFFERLHNLLAAVDAGGELAALALPAQDAIDLGRSSSLFGVDLLTQLALLADGYRCHDQFHAARFTGSVLAIAVLAEVAPFPVTALKSMLVEKAHGDLFQIGATPVLQQPYLTSDAARHLR